MKHTLLTRAISVFLDTEIILRHIMQPDGKAHGEIVLIHTIRGSIRHYEIGKYQREFLQAISV